MSLLLEIAIVFMLCILGDAVAILMPFPVPGNILGMLFLLAFLGLKWIRPKHIQNVAHFLLRNMAFFFIPSGVAIIKNYEYIQGQVIPILFVCVVSTIITFGVTGLTAQWIIAYQKKRRGMRNE